jgi:hypothetical protein
MKQTLSPSAGRCGSYQSRGRFTTYTTESSTRTSIKTPTTGASAASELNPNRLVAAATASSKARRTGCMVLKANTESTFYHSSRDP